MTTVLQSKQKRINEWLSEPTIHVPSQQRRPRANNAMQRRALSTPQLLTVASHRSLLLNTAYKSTSSLVASAPQRGLASSAALARSASSASSLRSRRQRDSRAQLHRTHTNFGYSVSLLDKYGIQVAQSGRHDRPKSAPGRPIFGAGAGAGSLSLELSFAHVVQRRLLKQAPAKQLSAQDKMHLVTIPVAPHNYSAQVGASFDEHGSWRNYSLRSLRTANGVDDRQLLETLDLHGKPLLPPKLIHSRTIEPAGARRKSGAEEGSRQLTTQSSMSASLFEPRAGAAGAGGAGGASGGGGREEGEELKRRVYGRAGGDAAVPTTETEQAGSRLDAPVSPAVSSAVLWAERQAVPHRLQAHPRPASAGLLRSPSSSLFEQAAQQLRPSSAACRTGHNDSRPSSASSSRGSTGWL